MNKFFTLLTKIFLFLIAIAFSIKSLREPDLWWQIRTGEWILQNNSVPQVDVFSYTMNGIPWINIKWGSELLFALMTKLSGPESVFLLQAVVSIIILVFMIKLSGRNAGNEKGNAGLLSLTITSIAAFICIQYRIIGRPEMFSHLFTIVFLYLLLNFREGKTKWIFLIIPLQLLWANLHEAFGIGIVMTAIFVFTLWFEYFFLKNRSKDERNKSSKLTLIWLISIASVLINPNGLKLLLRPLNIMDQVYENKFTTELLPFTEHSYWNYEAYITLIIFFISGLSLLHMFFIKSKRSIKTFLGKADLAYLLILIAFLYLALTAYRNIAFFVIVLFPIINKIIFDKIKTVVLKFSKFDETIPGLSFLLVFVLYVSIVSNKFYEIAESRDRFGLEVLSTHNPTGVAEYIENNNLKNKKCFSDYLTSSYLLWRLQPEFKTYIDLRDLDIFPQQFIDSFIDAANHPPLFFELDIRHRFDYVVLFRPQFAPLHTYLFNDSVYALTYIDAVAAVYEKTDHFTRDDIFTYLKPVKASPLSSGVNNLLNPFYKKSEYRINEDEIAANYYTSVLRFKLAWERAEKILQKKSEEYKANYLKGQISYEMYKREKDSQRKQQLIADAEHYYFESIRMSKSYAPALAGMGIIQYEKSNFVAAVKNFEKSLEQDNTDVSVHMLAAQVYKILASRKNDGTYFNQMIDHYKSALDHSPGNPYIEAEICIAYCNSGDCGRAVKRLKKLIDGNRISGEQLQQAEKCLKECDK